MVKERNLWQDSSERCDGAPPRETNVLTWAGSILLQGSRGHVCLYHVPLVPFISECHVTDDGDILHLLPLKAPSGNPEPPCPLPRLPTPSISGLLQSPLIQQPGMTQLVICLAWPHHPAAKGCAISRGSSGIRNAPHTHPSPGNGNISRDLSGINI